MSPELDSWSRNWSLAPTFFSASEIATLRARLSSFSPRHVVYCSFENRFARSGGLAPVVINALPALQASGRFESVSLLSPFYPRMMDEGKLSDTGASFDVILGSRKVRTAILRLEVAHGRDGAGSHVEYYLQAEGWFEAGAGALRDPYVYFEGDSSRNEQALRDHALFFCVAAPAALKALGMTKDVVLHLQEWQTALLSLTVKEAMLGGLLESCGTVQTIHNPYDTFLTKGDLRLAIPGTRRQARIAAMPGNGLTAFQVGLQLVDAPVATVSEHFAVELTTDVLQTRHFAPHLQPVFRADPVIGINNGPFVGFSDRFPRREHHTLEEIATIKREMRGALLAVLDGYAPAERFGELTWRGGSILTLPDDVPIIVMSGRLDPFQKGYDILLRALEGFAVDEIKAVLTPLPVRASDLDVFHEVAAACRGNVTVFPMRMTSGYVELQTGATFGVMPSIYEPFGAAIEYMVNGTPTIVRSTGGLVDQVEHGRNGLCYRERSDLYDLRRITSFIAASDRMTQRARNPWAADMVATLARTLQDAAALYRHRRDDYYALITGGFAKARDFNWDANVAAYAAVYEKIADTGVSSNRA